MNLSVPDELAAMVRAELPQLNVSRVFQRALRSLLDCEHHHVECARCGLALERAELANEALARFYVELMWEVGELVERCGTAEGAARVLKRVALGHRINRASYPLPRPTRAERELARDVTDAAAAG